MSDTAMGASQQGGDRAMAMEFEPLAQFLERVFPQAYESGHRLVSIAPYRATARLMISGPNGDMHLRPGGTVSGPAMFSLADYAFYAATLAMIGPVEMAVTVNLNINFLRKPKPTDLLCDVRILKLGRRLSIGDCTLYSEGDPAPVAHASTSYALPG